MKICIKIWLLLALVTAGGLVSAASKAGRSRVIIPQSHVSVRLSFAAPPRIDYGHSGVVKSVKWKWLRADVTYQFNPSLRFKPFFTYDDMRVEIYMQVFPTGGNWRGVRWFSGTQYLYKVIPESRGREKHLVSFFMPPGNIYNYAKRADSANLLKDCEGIVLFYNGDRLLGRAFFEGGSSRSRIQEKRVREIFAAYNLMLRNPNLLVKDGFWPREATPWRSLDAETADLPRPNFNKGTSSAGAPAPAPAPAAEAVDEESGSKQKETPKKEDLEEEDMKFTRSSSSRKNKRRGRK